jgi:tetratricopeptide (TPR) repeat protein
LEEAMKGVGSELYAAVALAALITWSCAPPDGTPGIDGDLFALDGVAPPGSDPEALIVTLLDRSAGASSLHPITVDYPLEGSVFPPEIVAPTFLWHDSDEVTGPWLIDIAFETTPYHIRVLTGGDRDEPEIDLRVVTDTNAYEQTAYQASARAWTPRADLWDTVKELSSNGDASVSVFGIAGGERDWGGSRIVSQGSVTIRTSRDPVSAMVFYRDVPVMPTETRKGVIQPLPESMFPLIEWRLRDLSEPSGVVVMSHLPTCANCHTFSADGTTLGMDMDGPGGDKGAYVLADVNPRMVLDQDDVFTWNDYPGKTKDLNTFGLFSQVSPDGRYVVTMVNEKIFLTNYFDVWFAQSFYPTSGVLVVYDRQTGKIESLPGADDPAYVQANPTWSPDQETIVFLRATARSPLPDGPPPTYANDPREPHIQYDLYRLPFRDGKGGTPEPVRGASGNGMSNSFPRFSPDGKWIVFVQARNGMLLRPDGKLYIIPAEGGEPRLMNCNTNRMNSYHSWSPNSRWLAFSSKVNRPFTQLFLTHVDENGVDTPPILVPNSTAANRAVNLPELVKLEPGELQEISTPAADYRRHLEAARALAEEGDIEASLAEFDKSLELKSDYWETHLLLADLLLRQGKPAEAIQHYQRSLALNPGHFATNTNLAVALRRVGRYDESRHHLEAALQINPDNARLHSSLGMTLFRAGELAEAGRHYQEALRLDPDLPHNHYRFGLLLLRTGQIDKAVDHLTQSVVIRPEDYQAHHHLGLALARQRRYAEAVEQYETAIGINADFEPAYIGLARLRAAVDDPGIRNGRQAVELAEEVCARSDSPQVSYLHTLAMAYAADGQFDKATATAEQALELARRDDDRRLETQIESHLGLFRQRRAVHSAD